MSASILEEARSFLVQSLQGKSNRFESRHPWRRGWEFAVLHSLRVETYVLKILAREQFDLPESDRDLIRLAAILHDIGRLEKREGHAALGAEIARQWMQEQAGFSLSTGDIQQVVDWIGDHSNKGVFEPDPRKAVLKDADTLDEIGVMSVLMTTNWVDPQSPLFFHHLRQRLQDVELPFCDQKLEILNTRGAREILNEKKAFLESFIFQLTDEIEMQTSLEKLFLELSHGRDE